MNKKEQAHVAELEQQIEALKTRLALRSTANVMPDVAPPLTGFVLSKGFFHAGSRGDHSRVEVACSSATGHAIGSDERTGSQRPIWLYSSRLSALRALRYEVEGVCAAKLRNIDKMIEAEESK